MFSFKEKDRVSFKYSGVEGVGFICGKATTELPVVGSFYIVRVDGSNIDNEEYPFSCISVPESSIKLL